MIGALAGIVGGPLGRWVSMAALVAAGTLVGYLHGRAFERGVADAERLRQADEFIKKLADRASKDALETRRVAEALNKEKSGRAVDRRRFEEKLRDVPKQRIVDVVAIPCADTRDVEPAGGGQAPAPAVPAVRLSAVGCGLWNDALASGATAAERPEWIAGADGCTGPVEIEDALENLQRNAALLGECRAREQLTHDWFRREGFLGAQEGQ